MKVKLDINKMRNPHEYIIENKDYIENLLDSSLYINRKMEYETASGRLIEYSDEDDVITEYARQLVSGEVISGEFNIKGAIRHLEFLIQPDSKYYVDIHEVQKVIKFCETGEDNNNKKALKLIPFQKYIIGGLYGWRVKKNRHRRYKYGLVIMARRNGKSFLQSRLLAYDLIFGNSPIENRVLFCSANDEKQSSIIYNYCKKMLEKMKVAGFKEVIDRYEEKGGELRNKLDGSYLRALTSNLDALDGYESTLAVLDEVHKFKDSELFDVVTSGQKMLDCQTIMITTVGDDLTGYLYKEYQNALKRMDGVLPGIDKWFYYICQLDDDTELNNPDMWEKSNPILSSDDKEMVEKLRESIEDEYQNKYLAGNKDDYLIKTHCMWASGGEKALVDIKDWDKHEVNKFSTYGRECYIGIDLSQSNDLSAVTFTYPVITEGGDIETYVESKGFIPTPEGNDISIRSAKEGINYMRFVEDKEAELTTSASGLIDESQIVRYIIRKVSSLKLEVLQIYYDPAYSVRFQNELYKLDKDLYNKLVEVGQHKNNYSSAISGFRKDLIEGKVKHVRNDLLRYSIINTKVKNIDGLYMPEKRSGLTNDCSIAMLMAYKGIINHDEFSQQLIDTYVWDVWFGGV